MEIAKWNKKNKYFYFSKVFSSPQANKQLKLSHRFEKSSNRTNVEKAVPYRQFSNQCSEGCTHRWTLWSAKGKNSIQNPNIVKWLIFLERRGMCSRFFRWLRVWRQHKGRNHSFGIVLLLNWYTFLYWLSDKSKSNYSIIGVDGNHSLCQSLLSGLRSANFLRKLWNCRFSDYMLWRFELLIFIIIYHKWQIWCD